MSLFKYRTPFAARILFMHFDIDQHICATLGRKFPHISPFTLIFARPTLLLSRYPSAHFDNGRPNHADRAIEESRFRCTRKSMMLTAVCTRRLDAYYESLNKITRGIQPLHSLKKSTPLPMARLEHIIMMALLCHQPPVDCQTDFRQQEDATSSASRQSFDASFASWQLSMPSSRKATLGSKKQRRAGSLKCFSADNTSPRRQY